MEIERSKKNWFLKKKSKNILSERREGLEAETGIIPGMAYSREEFVKKCCKDLLATAESLFGQWHFPTPLQMPHFRGISIKRATYFKNCSICNITRLKCIYPALLWIITGDSESWFMLRTRTQIQWVCWSPGWAER